MKKTLVWALSVAVVAISMSVAVRAEDTDQAVKKPSRRTEEQRKLHKEIVEKYDINKNGKLDKEERSKISKEDREKMNQAGLGGHRKPAAAAEKKDSSK